VSSFTPGSGRRTDAAAQDRPKEGRIPWGALDIARLALEAARPDTKEGGAVRAKVDEAIHYLDKAGANL
jgi:hypothetical protein